MMLRLISNTGLSGLPKSRPVCAGKGRQLDRSGNGEGYAREYDWKNPMMCSLLLLLKDIFMCYNLIGYNALQFVLYS